MNKTTSQIKRYMQANIADHIDVLTGEVNDTSLAEDTIWYFVNCVPEEEDIIFSLAHDVAHNYEIRHNQL